jgi:hypothetical protein
MCVVQKYFLTCLMTKLWKSRLWVRGSCWVKSIKFELIIKAWSYKKNSSFKFS